MKGYLLQLAGLLLFISSCGGGGGSESADCVTHYECSVNDICVYGECVVAYGKEYSIFVKNAVLSQYDQTGSAWDFPGGMPDPRLCFYKNLSYTPASPNESVWCTSTMQDTFTPNYAESFRTTIYESDRWIGVVFDEDVTDWEFVEGFEFNNGIPVEIIKSGGFRVQGTYVLDLLVDIDPVE